MKPVRNPEYDKAEEVHFIVHPQSGFKCACSMCMNSKPIKVTKGKAGKVYFEKVGKQ